MSQQIIELTERLAKPIAAELGFEVVDVEYKQEGKNWFLRVFIDSDDGVDIDDCSKISERLSEQLDELDPVKTAYYLEVSSPGAERPLKGKEAITRAVGKNVHVKTKHPVEGENVLEGKLSDFDGEVLTLEVKEKQKKRELTVEYDNVAHARLAIIF
ncbi:ribosome maturation factor RimP [Salsuginibacillus kocurii]|uniref:ribosome maturation factor RimP n=1 Tax=Salsuginibacillus kocurii TaxID=427078 RepID=UPI00036184CE|nr:ribosome maturation factor RimP [Salsuginibacillus kocurii]